jgi:hypothetical protein
VLGEKLVESGLLSSQRLAELQAAAQQTGLCLAARLIDEKVFTADEIADFLERELNKRCLSAAALIPTTDALDLVNKDLARRLLALPLYIARQGPRRLLCVAMADPSDLNSIAELELATGCEVNGVLANASDLRKLQTLHFRSERNQNPTGSYVMPRNPFSGTLEPRTPQVTEELRTLPLQRLEDEAGPEIAVRALVALLIRRGIIEEEEYLEEVRKLIEDDSNKGR